ncbi:hypothetical protein NTGHW29_20015 [Candidatus Nitrotoga sp. HW29]|nr:hypothetical protein [Candidatus Nitrotoga sp. HW29]CAH1903960.1 hypothetical protein NTGHW29_20015 [Candidatus Nitrotoga sp. HW29]
MIEVRRYQRIDGEVPLTDWLAGMRDARAKAKLEIRFRLPPSYSMRIAFH